MIGDVIIRNNDDDKHNDEDMIMQVESSKVGKIIGRGGSKIRELQDSSGARINIDKNSGGSTAEVTLVGSNEAQNCAKTMIDELVNEER